ncbi:MAG: hypothetical protein KZQ95_12835 [Candidatus Thiodiazotropha sp. (ex Epidulcina cf. delphinae)]|nr:hypothetical protein [Candidatus Thiodiazotropha sp. (ex Epidulcina cf. delphinae)]
MTDRAEIIENEIREFNKALRAFYGPYLRMEAFEHDIIEEATPLELMRLHGLELPCHMDVIITRQDYRFKIVMMFAHNLPPGDFKTVTATTIDWYKIEGEQVVTTEKHCPEGGADVPEIPDNYCMLIMGDKVVWKGNERCTVKINYGGHSVDYEPPTGDIDYLSAEDIDRHFHERYILENIDIEAPKIIERTPHDFGITETSTQIDKRRPSPM